MRIHSYIISNPDESPVIRDAIQSLSGFSDKIFVIDGGLSGGTLDHHPEHFVPLRYVLGATTPVYLGDESHGWFGNIYGVPLRVWEHGFDDPASQRNWTLAEMAKEPEQPDFIIWIDSDEVCSSEFICGIKSYLESLPEDATNVTVQWLNLVQDEHHCIGGQHSTWLAHSRIHRPNKVYFSGSWHENMVYEGKRERFDTRIIHVRSLWRRRLLVQRGHPVIKGKSLIRPEMQCFHDDAVMVDIPEGVTWPCLNYPADEIVPFDFGRDALEVWDELGNLREKIL